MEHHKELPPSSAPAILQCARYEPDPVVGKAAKRGTKLHECLAAALTGLPMPMELQGDDMQEVLWAMECIMCGADDGELRVEEKVNIKGADGREISFGHADAYRIVKE